MPGRGADADGVIHHEVDARVHRGVSWFILAVALLAPFAKGKVNVLFTGKGVVTSAVEPAGDVSVDTVRTAILPVYKLFGIEKDLEIRCWRSEQDCEVC